MYIWIYHPQMYSYEQLFLYHAGKLYHHKYLREEYKGDKMKLPIKKMRAYKRTSTADLGIN